MSPATRTRSHHQGRRRSLRSMSHFSASYMISNRAWRPTSSLQHHHQRPCTQTVKAVRHAAAWRHGSPPIKLHAGLCQTARHRASSARLQPYSHPVHSASSASSTTSAISSASDVVTSASEHASPDAQAMPQLLPVLQRPVVIIGAGPAGLSTALMLARRGYSDIRV